MASHGPTNTNTNNSTGQQQQTGSGSGVGASNSPSGGAGTRGGAIGYMSRILGCACHSIRTPAEKLASAKAMLLTAANTIDAQRGKHPQINWEAFDDALRALNAAAAMLNAAGPDANADLEHLQRAIDALLAEMLQQVQQSVAQEAMVQPLSTLAGMQQFLQTNLVSTAGLGQNGALSFFLTNVGEDAQHRPKWQFTKPPMGKPAGQQALNFIMNPVKNYLDKNNVQTGQPNYLTIPATTTDAMVTTGMVNGCTLAAFKMPDGSVKIVHLQPREDKDRPDTDQIPTGYSMPPGKPRTTVLSADQISDYLARENAAMRKMVEDYATSVGAGPVSFFQSAYGSDTASTYDRQTYAYNNIIGRVENGVLHLLSQQVRLDNGPPVVKEIFTIPLGLP
jgi:hypothetical protein